MAKLETVRVYWPAKFGDDVVLINVSDFDPSIHTRADEGRPDAKQKQPAEPRRKVK